MTSIFHRAPGAALATAVAGEGVYLIDKEGRRYLDASGGAAVSCLGHNHPRVMEAMKRQIDRLSFAHTAFFTNEPAEALAEHLIAKAPASFGKVYFLSGGSEAIETALKLARAYHLARGEPERMIFISRRQSYHGNTIGALSISGNPGRRRPYEPLLPPHERISPCYAYRGRQEGESDMAYGRRMADELETAIDHLGANRVAAFVAETVVGATLGACPASGGYFRRIREICDAHGILYIADEVMCGMGRTGHAYAFEAEGAAPDIIAVAKGLAGGYQAMGATLASHEVYETVARKGFEHGHTYIGHALGCAAALAVQGVIEEDGLLAKVREKGRSLSSKLKEKFAGHEAVGDIRGRGLFMGIELVEDRAEKRPFPAERRLAARIKQEALANGLICYPGSGCVDGRLGDHVLLAPPFIITDGELDLLVEKLAHALDAALAA